MKKQGETFFVAIVPLSSAYKTLLKNKNDCNNYV